MNWRIVPITLVVWVQPILILALLVELPARPAWAIALILATAITIAVSGIWLAVSLPRGPNRGQHELWEFGAFLGVFIWGMFIAALIRSIP